MFAFNMMNGDFSGMDALLNRSFAKIQMLHTRRSGAFGPLDATLIIVEHIRAGGCVRETQVGATVADQEDLFDALVRGMNLRFT